MRLPRDVFGRDLAKALQKLGYQESRKTGSHIRVSRAEPSEHHVTIPAHSPIKVGTLNAILRDIAAENGLSREALLQKLFG